MIKSSSVVGLLGQGLTPGKLRGLQRISNPNGTLSMVALDQNSSMINMMKESFKKKGQEREPTYEEVVEAKVDLVQALGTHCSAILIDAYYGAFSFISSMSLPRNTGLLIRVERSGGPKNSKGAPIGEYEPGWSVGKIKRMGADAVKLLAQFEPRESDSAEKNLAFIEHVYRECQKHDILLLLETVSFPFKQGNQNEDKKSASYLNRKAETVIESARQLSSLCDIYKAEFPGTFGHETEDQCNENLRRLDEACKKPWVLLSAGVDFHDYKRQVDMALKAGASGVLGGRAFWKEYFTFDRIEDRKKFARSESAERVKQIHQMVVDWAKPWFARYGFSTEHFQQFRATEGCHSRYGGPLGSSDSARGPVAAGDVY
jgi:tagatose 1,6-diphosphate aldolase